MSPHFKESIKYIALGVLLVVIGLTITSCSTTDKILAGATHACGTLHVEGYFTDTQGEVVIAKAPDNWTPEQVEEFCNQE